MIYRHHCILYQDKYGIVLLKNLSRNGIWINGSLLQKNQKCMIQNNDVIELARACKQYPAKLLCAIYLKTQLYQIGSYLLFSLLGSGTTANVYECSHFDTKETYAIKIFHSIDNLQIFQREKDILNSIHHPQIIKLIDSLETSNILALVFEFVEAIDLIEYMIITNTEFAEQRAKFIFIQLIQILDYLHSKNIIHRDLKLENILIIEDNHNQNKDEIKLIDFGLARYLAPEIIQMFHCPESEKKRWMVILKKSIYGRQELFYISYCVVNIHFQHPQKSKCTKKFLQDNLLFQNRFAYLLLQ